MKIRTILFLTFFLAISVLYVLSSKVRGVEIQSLGLIFPVGAALVGLYTSRIFGFKSANGRALLLITAGIACWAIGEILFWVFANIMNIDPFPSLADAFFLLAYPFFGVGIYQSFTTAGVKLKQVNRLLLVTVLSASLVLTVLVAYFGVYLAYDASADPLANVVNVVYGLGDLVLVIFSMLTILVASEYKGGKLASFWKIMASGFILILIADIVFAIYGDQILNDIKPYTYVDLIWTAGYQLLAYGMLENYIHVSAVQKNIKLKLQQRQ